MSAPGPEASTEPGDAFVQALARGLSVIRAFDAEHPRLTLSEAAKRTGLSRATVRRLLKTLVGLGYATQHDDAYALSPRILELGFSYLASMPLQEVVEPHLQSLSAELGESSSAAVLDADRVVYIARVHTRRILRINLGVGSRLPAAWTAMGRVLLAERPDAEIDEVLRRGADGRPTPADAVRRARAAIETVRRTGYAVVDQELEPGLRTVGLAVRDARGAALCAVNVASSAGATDLRWLETRALDALRRCVAGIERDLASQSGR